MSWVPDWPRVPSSHAVAVAIDECERLARVLRQATDEQESLGAVATDGWAGSSRDQFDDAVRAARRTAERLEDQLRHLAASLGTQLEAMELERRRQELGNGSPVPTRDGQAGAGCP